MTFYIDAKEMTAFAIENFTKVMGAVLASLNSRPGEQSGVRAEPQSYNLKMVSEIPLHLILFKQYVLYEISCSISTLFVILRFTAEFYNRQMKEVDSNIQPLLKEIFRKFDEYENCTTVAIQMRNGIKYVTVSNAIKIAAQPAITCSKLTIETLEQGVKYVQS